MVDDKMCPSLCLPFCLLTFLVYGGSPQRSGECILCVCVFSQRFCSTEMWLHTMWMIGFEEAIVVISPLEGYDPWSMLEVFFKRVWLWCKCLLSMDTLHPEYSLTSSDNRLGVQEGLRVFEGHFLLDYINIPWKFKTKVCSLVGSGIV